MKMDRLPATMQVGPSSSPRTTCQPADGSPHPPVTPAVIQLLESPPAAAGVELLEGTPAAAGPELLEAEPADAEPELPEPAPATAGLGTCLKAGVVLRRWMKQASTSCARMTGQGLNAATSITWFSNLSTN